LEDTFEQQQNRAKAAQLPLIKVYATVFKYSIQTKVEYIYTSVLAALSYILGFQSTSYTF